jgi:hypothetical protein
LLVCDGTRTSLPAKPSPIPNDAGPIVRRPKGVPVAAGCDRAWTRTRTSSGTALDHCTTREAHRRSGSTPEECVFFFLTYTFIYNLIMNLRLSFLSQCSQGCRSGLLVWLCGRSVVVLVHCSTLRWTGCSNTCTTATLAHCRRDTHTPQLTRVGTLLYMP